MSDACIAFGCDNPVVRVFVHSEHEGVHFGVCAFHGERMMAYMTDDQVKNYVFPEES